MTRRMMMKIGKKIKKLKKKAVKILDKINELEATVAAKKEGV